MTRWTFRILFFLILGVVTTVGVAWGLAWLARPFPPSSGMGRADYLDCSYGFFVSESFGVTVIESVAIFGELMQDEGRFYTAEGMSGLPFVPPADLPDWSRVREPFGPATYEWSERMNADECALGWPVRAMRCTVFPMSIEARGRSSKSPFLNVTESELWWIAADGKRYSIELVPGDGVEYGILIGETGSGVFREFHALPLRPIFPGFIINTLFYAAIWFGVFFGIGFAKRALRRKRGRCIKCNYDLRGDLATGCPECGWNREP